MKPRLLLTGFEPFHSWTINSSWEAARLVGERLGPEVVVHLLPVEHHRAREQLLSLVDELRPEVCLCTGLTPREAFALERQARKPIEFADLPGEPRHPGAWPWEASLTTLHGCGVPADYSDDAGQFVCESTYWALLDFRQRHGFPAEAAFLHVPPLSERFPLEKTTAVVEAVVRQRLGSRERFQ